jgi:hypothetical protein
VVPGSGLRSVAENKRYQVVGEVLAGKTKRAFFRLVQKQDAPEKQQAEAKLVMLHSGYLVSRHLYVRTLCSVVQVNTINMVV